MGLLDQLNRLLGARSHGSAAPGGGETVPEPHRAAVEAVQQAVAYRFRDPSLLYRALVHRSYAHATGADRIATNERLEFLGDAVLGMLVSETLYREYRDREEGDLTKMKARLVCGANLSRVAGVHDLGDHVLISRGEESTGGRERASILADVVEAILGAVYLDGGLSPTRGVLERLLLDDIDVALDSDDLGNNKSRLQERIQAHFKSPPRYRVLDVSGPDHDRRYSVEVGIAGNALGHGEGHSKKSAEQVAAGAALDLLDRHPDLFGGGSDDENAQDEDPDGRTSSD